MEPLFIENLFKTTNMHLICIKNQNTTNIIRVASTFMDTNQYLTFGKTFNKIVLTYFGTKKPDITETETAPISSLEKSGTISPNTLHVCVLDEKKL